MTLATDRAHRGPWTYERLRAETDEDAVRREIIDGWLYIDGQRVDDPHADVAAESSASWHGSVVIALIRELLLATADLDGQLVTAPQDVAFGDRILQPDVFWVPAEIPRDAHPIRARPDLVIEVSSPSTRRHDLVRKRRVYEQAGVPEYWFVDHDGERVEVYVLPDKAEVYPEPHIVTRGRAVTATVVSGVSVQVDAILGPPED